MRELLPDLLAQNTWRSANRAVSIIDGGRDTVGHAEGFVSIAALGRLLSIR